MRRCKACGKEKSLESFPPYTARGVAGRRWTCRECWGRKWYPVQMEHGRRYYHENRGGYADRQRIRTRLQHAAEKTTGAHERRNRAYAERHPERTAAKRSVAMAVRSGRLTRLPCQVCGGGCSQAHHDDYGKLLDVIWLCPTHHGERHRLLSRDVPNDRWPAEWPEDLHIRCFPEVSR